MDWTRNQRRLLHDFMDKRSPAGLGKRGKNHKRKRYVGRLLSSFFLVYLPSYMSPDYRNLEQETWWVCRRWFSFISFILAIVMYRSKTGPALSNVIHPQKEKETNILFFHIRLIESTHVSIHIDTQELCVCASYLIMKDFFDRLWHSEGSRK